MKDVRVAVVGVGALGQHHARVLDGLPGARLVYVCDIDRSRAEEVASRHRCQAASDPEEILSEVEAVVLAVPTLDHHRLAKLLLEAGKDVLVEKPMTKTLAEADDLVKVAEANGALLQVGHVERFNPAADALRGERLAPRFIEVHRLGSFTPRSLDIDVVLDLMIHDLDLVVLLDGSEAVQVDAVGVPVLTDKVDIANARIRFASGLIANLTASRVSAEKVRKFRVFAPGIYVSVDFQARESRVYRLVVGEGGRPDISVDRSGASEEEPLSRQLAAFLEAVRTRRTPEVSGVVGRRVLALALQILDRMGNLPASNV